MLLLFPRSPCRLVVAIPGSGGYRRAARPPAAAPDDGLRSGQGCTGRGRRQAARPDIGLDTAGQFSLLRCRVDVLRRKPRVGLVRTEHSVGQIVVQINVCSPDDDGLLTADIFRARVNSWSEAFDNKGIMFWGGGRTEKKKEEKVEPPRRPYLRAAPVEGRGTQLHEYRTS